MTVKQLPVLFLSDVVLLPGMVVPIELDEAAQAAVDAAQAASPDGGELLVAATRRTAWSRPWRRWAGSAAARRPPSSAPAAGRRSAPA